MTFQEFVDMGGYGWYIWGSYGIALIVFVGLFISVKAQRNKLIKQLSRRYRLQKDKQSENNLKNSSIKNEL
jgi:heme exporter protein D